MADSIFSVFHTFQYILYHLSFIHYHLGLRPSRKPLHDSLRQHSLGHLHEAGHIGTFHIVDIA